MGLFQRTGWMKLRDRRSMAVFALVERGGKAVAVPIVDWRGSGLRGVLKKRADTRSALMTDEWSAYDRPGREFATWSSVESFGGGMDSG